LGELPLHWCGIHEWDPFRAVDNAWPAPGPKPAAAGAGRGGARGAGGRFATSWQGGAELEQQLAGGSALLERLCGPADKSDALSIQPVAPGSLCLLVCLPLRLGADEREVGPDCAAPGDRGGIGFRPRGAVCERDPPAPGLAELAPG